MSNIKPITYQEWSDRGTKLYGENMINWRFKCPMCGFKASGRDYQREGATPGMIGFSCIGRSMPNRVSAFFPEKGQEKGSPCDYAGGGLFEMNPVHVLDENGELHKIFEFADEVSDVLL